MTNDSQREEQIFSEAIEIADLERRRRFLDEVCGADDELRRRIERLIEAEEAGQELFARVDEAEREGSSPHFTGEQVGDQIGRYKLLEQIGEGGFGLVFMAEQTEPVRRKVALKIIKLGMDTKQVVARFEAERQALALMDHPHIAQVLDGGATETGRPYFVMELVRGMPITEYCDKQKLTTRERLELFIPVCQAVQHAHQKGIIHRDLKPGNVMVTMSDGVPHPMVIDFGVAKAINQKLTEQTLFTNLGQMIGTPAYMAPEQAEMSRLDVDTRSDIYSLGVLLYELLTGTQPFPEQELRSASWVEMQRIIAEKEPPTPSRRLSTLTADQRTNLAKEHQESPGHLTGLLRGDLDWIVMKCLEKDRNRRYETANGLAADIRRHLKGNAIEAAPPTFSYRSRKFLRKYRKTVLVASAFTLVLISATIFSILQAVRAKQAQTAARQNADESQALNRFLTDDLFGVADIEKAEAFSTPDRNVKLLEVVNRASEAMEQEGRFQNQPLVAAKLHETLGNIYGGLGETTKAEAHLRDSVELYEIHAGYDDIRTASALHGLAVILDVGRAAYPEAESLIRRAIDIRIEHLGPDAEETIASQIELSEILMRQAKYPEAKALLDGIERTSVDNFGENHRLTLMIRDRRVDYLWDTGKRAAAVKLTSEVLDARRAFLGNGHPDTLGSIFRAEWFGFEYTCDPVRSEKLNEEGLRLSRKLYGERRMTILFNGRRAVLLARKGLGKASADLRLTLFNAQRAIDPDSREALLTKLKLAFHEAAYNGNGPRAASLLEEVLGGIETINPDYFTAHICRDWLSGTYWQLGRFEDALRVRHANVESMSRAFDAGARRWQFETLDLAAMHAQLGQWEEAVKLLEKVNRSLEPPKGSLGELLLVEQMMEENPTTDGELRKLLTNWIDNPGDWRFFMRAEETPVALRTVSPARLRELTGKLPDPRGRILARVFLARTLIQEGLNGEANAELNVARALLDRTIANGLLGTGWRKTLVCEIAVRSVAASPDITESPPRLDSDRLRLLREEWRPTKELINGAFKKARGRDWAAAAETLDTLIQSRDFSWEAAEASVSRWPLKLAVVFLLGDRPSAYAQVCRRYDGQDEGLDSRYKRISLLPVDGRAESSSFLINANRAKFQPGNDTVWPRAEAVDLFEGMELLALGDRRKALEVLSKALDGYDVHIACAAQALAAQIQFAEGNPVAGRKLLHQAKQTLALIEENHPGTLANNWFEYGLCHIVVRDARTAARQVGE